MREVLKGSVDQSCVIRIIDATDGTPETGVVAATSGLDLKYRRELGAAVDLTESDLAALTTAHADGGLKHVGSGYYRVDLPDAAVATGANGVLVFGTVTNMVVIGCYLPLVNWNPYDVNGRIDAHVVTMATDAIAAASVSSAAANKMADQARRRTQANVEASSDGDALSVGSEYGAIQQMQEASVTGTTMTIFKTDGTTSLGTKTLASDPAADPITGIS